MTELIFKLFRIHVEKGAARELVPVRPVAILAGCISLKSKHVVQLA